MFMEAPSALCVPMLFAILVLLLTLGTGYSWNMYPLPPELRKTMEREALAHKTEL